MSLSSDVIQIRKLTKILSSSKDAEVTITYKGTEYGVAKPWLIRCETNEATHETPEGAAQELLFILKNKLKAKIDSAEQEVNNLRKALGSFGN
jgi:hypothetical protein